MAIYVEVGLVNNSFHTGSEKFSAPNAGAEKSKGAARDERPELV